MRALLFACVLLAVTTQVDAQQRVAELALDVGTVGNATRDLGYVETRERLDPTFGAALRLSARVLEQPRFGQLHLGAHLGATIWRTTVLGQTERAFRTYGDLGLFVRWRPTTRVAPTLSFAMGASLGVPSIAELYSAVPFGYGLFTDVAVGTSWRDARLRLGGELAYTYHGIVTRDPRATTRTHVLVLRLVVAWTSRSGP